MNSERLALTAMARGEIHKSPFFTTTLRLVSSLSSAQNQCAILQELLTSLWASIAFGGAMLPCATLLYHSLPRKVTCVSLARNLILTTMGAGAFATFSHVLLTVHQCGSLGARSTCQAVIAGHLSYARRICAVMSWALTPYLRSDVKVALVRQLDPRWRVWNRIMRLH